MNDYRDEAMLKLQNNSQKWLTVSGKMASGKDTLAPLMMDIISKNTPKQRLGYSDVLRKEANAVFQYYRDWKEKYTKNQRLILLDRTEKFLIREYGMRPIHAKNAVARLSQEIDTNNDVNAEQRTVWMRDFLIDLGGVWHTVDNPYYLPNQMWNIAAEFINNGIDVYLTGGRLLPDILGPASKGSLTVRIQVDREVQKKRIKERDNIDVTDSVLDSYSECALDDYNHIFDIVITNNGTLDEALEEFTVKYNEFLEQPALPLHKVL